MLMNGGRHESAPNQLEALRRDELVELAELVELVELVEEETKTSRLVRVFVADLNVAAQAIRARRRQARREPARTDNPSFVLATVSIRSARIDKVAARSRRLLAKEPERTSKLARADASPTASLCCGDAKNCYYCYYYY